MKVLLKSDIPNLGYTGEVVKVAPGYARNYLFPHDMATEPTQANLRAVDKLRKVADDRRRLARQEAETLAARLGNVEVTIAAAANREGHLYGSVGAREISAALREDGYPIASEQVRLKEPIRNLDRVLVDLHLGHEVTAQVKVWVVPESGSEAEEAAEVRAAEKAQAAEAARESEHQHAGRDAGADAEDQRS